VATFVLIPGAGGNAAYWSRLVTELERRGHHGVPVEIPQDDPALVLTDWAATVEAAVPATGDAILVAQSLGGFVAPLVRRPVRMIVLLNAMIPEPHETPDDWWEATGSQPARRAADQAAGRDPEFDLERHFLHDLSDEARAALFAAKPRDASATAMASPCDFDTWPDVPIRVLAGRDDRFFPLEFQRRVAAQRLGRPVDEVPGGHLAAVSFPAEVAEQLSRYAAEPG
jgi:pimeloyl-ACP methyl ester carboxylesterase